MLHNAYLQCNNNNNETLFRAQFPKNKRAQSSCTIIITRYTNSHDTRDKYNLNMRTLSLVCTHTHKHTQQHKCEHLPTKKKNNNSQLNLQVVHNTHFSNNFVTEKMICIHLDLHPLWSAPTLICTHLDLHPPWSAPTLICTHLDLHPPWSAPTLIYTHLDLHPPWSAPTLICTHLDSYPP